jgi:predicted metal-dependent hydrolase
MVTSEGQIVVALPARWPLAEADGLLARHRAWITKRLQQLHAEQARLAARPALSAGRTLEVDGRPMRVRLLEEAPVVARGRVDVVGDELRVRLGREGSSLETVLEHWLRERAREVIAARIATRAVEMEVHPGRLSIRDQTTRWASAARSGNLSFCWRLVLAPPDVLDAIVVHELAHLRVPGHSRTFWALVERHAPQAPAAHRWLHAHARELRTALG